MEIIYRNKCIECLSLVILIITVAGPAMVEGRNNSYLCFIFHGGITKDEECICHVQWFSLSALRLTTYH
jgi:hypothetical protein